MKITLSQRCAIIFALLGGVALPANAFPITHSVPPESFLDYHVDTVPQLSFEVAYDPAVRARLAHHFHLSGPAMCAYVQKNLILQHLSKPLKTRVYCVRRDGHEFYVMMTLKAGTPVFALRRTGKPILRLACGNPLVPVLPPMPKKAAVLPPHAVTTRVAGAHLLQIIPAVATAPSPLAALPIASIISTTGEGEVFFTAAGSSAGSLLGWVPLAGGTLALLSQNGGKPVNTPTPDILDTQPPTTPNGAPQPVPEPAPAIALLLGALGLTILRLHQQRLTVNRGKPL
jgi:hypothetical protein